MKINQDRKITALAQETHGAYTVEVFDYADTWLLEEPAPANWHELVYHVTKNGRATRQYPPSIAKIGHRMVEEMKNKPTTPTQTSLFPTGNDLPLFSLTPVRAEMKPYHPAPVAKQTGMYACPVCKDSKNFAGKPCPACR